MLYCFVERTKRISGTWCFGHPQSTDRPKSHPTVCIFVSAAFFSFFPISSPSQLRRGHCLARREWQRIPGSQWARNWWGPCNSDWRETLLRLHNHSTGWFLQLPSCATWKQASLYWKSNLFFHGDLRDSFYGRRFGTNPPFFQSNVMRLISSGRRSNIIIRFLVICWSWSELIPLPVVDQKKPVRKVHHVVCTTQGVWIHKTPRSIQGDRSFRRHRVIHLLIW